MEEMKKYEQIEHDIPGIMPDYQKSMKIFLNSINTFVDILNNKITEGVNNTLKNKVKITTNMFLSIVFY